MSMWTDPYNPPYLVFDPQDFDDYWKSFQPQDTRLDADIFRIMNNLKTKARSYANTALKAYGDVTIIGLFISDIVKAVEDAYIQGAKDAMRLPLSDKLSDRETRDIKTIYTAAKDRLDQPFAAGYCQAIERIFGRDFVQT